MSAPRVEILYVGDCPNYKPARELVERIAGELGVQPAIELVEVADADAAVERGFLGSPTVRVNGVDVEPGADQRYGFVLACRVYRSERGLVGVPDARWIRTALTEHANVSTIRADDRRATPCVAAVLAAADIPSSKLGPTRWAGLTRPERNLYVWILRAFASTGRPRARVVREQATQLGVNFERSFESFARDDLVHLDTDGEIGVAYPFSGRPTMHLVRFPNGNEVHAMCAIDALGIAPMFNDAIEVKSQDPLTGEDVFVRVGPNGAGEWHPDSAVAVAGAVRTGNASFCSCCPVLNFFSSSANAEQWLEQNSAVRGDVISIHDAAGAGLVVFGDVLRGI